MTHTVAAIEDDPRYRAGVERLLERAESFRLAGAFGSAEEALQAAERDGLGKRWDVVLMDLELPGMSGIDATRRFKGQWPQSKVVVLTVFEEPRTVLEAICAGADGYLLKSASGEEILDQLRVSLGDGASLTPGVARTVLGLLREPLPRPHRDVDASPPARMDLTPREQDVLRALVQGLAYKQVASTLGISVDTVRYHIKAIYRKLQVHGVAEAVTRAVRERLV